ncbi:MAG: hypothetical protein KGH75_12535 [Rhodospirillales bacterium]|nr:hypothetical protein [Rhodospirillales bacterium]
MMLLATTFPLPPGVPRLVVPTGEPIKPAPPVGVSAQSICNKERAERYAARSAALLAYITEHGASTLAEISIGIRLSDKSVRILVGRMIKDGAVVFAGKRENARLVGVA